MTDAASDNERPLIAHLLELRSRLLRGAVGLLLALHCLLPFDDGALSSPRRAAGLSSSPFMPFLNSSTALPRSRAPPVRRLVPNTSTTMSSTTSQCQMLKLPMILPLP